MVLSRTMLLLAALLLAAPASFADPARESGTPDSARLAKLAVSFADGAVARVRSTGGTSLLRQVRVSNEGIAGAVATFADGAITSYEHEDRLIAWSEIERVDRLDSWARRGARVGLVGGLVAGVVLAASIDEPMGARPAVGFVGATYTGRPPSAPIMERAFVIVATPLLGALTGGLVGSFVPRWRAVGP